MKPFLFEKADSILSACEALQGPEPTKVMAGGTDLITVLKGDILPQYPKRIIDLKSVPGLSYVRVSNEHLCIGALTTLTEIVDSKIVAEHCPALIQAAESVATPQIRNIGTLGGNLCQDTRCWYYRYPNKLGGRILCLRKGEGYCLAAAGKNKYHAVVDARKCFAVCPSDTATALTALDAELVTVGVRTGRVIPVASFYTPFGNVLNADEIVTEIRIPLPENEMGQCFLKKAERASIDFASVSGAVTIQLKEGICTAVRIVLGAVSYAPYRTADAENSLIGRPLTENVIRAAGERVLADARPLRDNNYKVEIARTLVCRAIREAADRGNPT